MKAIGLLMFSLFVFVGCSDSEQMSFGVESCESTIACDTFAVTPLAVADDFSERSPLFASRAGSGTELTAYGYTSLTSGGNKTYALDKQLKEILKIPRNKYYVCCFYTAKYSVSIKGLKDGTSKYLPMYSPNCGVVPDHSREEWDVIGYASSFRGEQVVMTTQVVHVIADYEGISYDIWYPCKLDKLQWNYSVE